MVTETQKKKRIIYTASRNRKERDKEKVKLIESWFVRGFHEEKARRE